MDRSFSRLNLLLVAPLGVALILTLTVGFMLLGSMPAAGLALIAAAILTAGVFVFLFRNRGASGVRQPGESSLETAERYRMLLNQSEDPIVVFDVETGQPVDFNSNAHAFLGYSAEEFRNLSIYDFDFMESREEALEHLVCVCGEGGETYETKYLTKAGEVRDVLVSCRALHEGGRRLCQTLFHDITERNRAAADLLRIRAAVDDASDAIITTDMEGHVTYMNLAFAETFRCTPDAGVSLEDLGIFRDQRVLSQMLQEVFTLERWDGETIMRAADGREYPAHVRATPVLGDHIEAIGALLVIGDITERKNMERHLLQAQKLQSIGQLAAGVAHEINTPTQYVGDNARFLQDGFGVLSGALAAYGRLLEAVEQDGRGLEAVEAVRRHLEEADIDYMLEEIPRAIGQSLEGIEHVATIVKAMREFSHPGLEEKTTVDINQALQSTIMVARSEWKYVATVETDFDSTLPMVYCLPGEINQVVLNLIINASHAIEGVLGPNPETKGVITISTHHRGEHVEIRVRDTGPGIPAEVRDRVFDPFFTTKAVGKGSGQGLSIAHNVIVEKHGGEITFETVEGEGTTFIIRLPVETAAATKN